MKESRLQIDEGGISLQSSICYQSHCNRMTFFIRWINWNKKLKLKTKNILFLTFRLFYTLWIERTKNTPFLPLLKKCFLVPPYSKCIKKLSNFHLNHQKIFWFLVFSFQFIQQIELMSVILMDIIRMKLRQFSSDIVGKNILKPLLMIHGSHFL